ncbi:MAG: DUF1320 domain-containing protein [Methylobacter sp.]|uniref:gp436 family protein n=1 Tax=Methylobacter sp. TaxID=2051955 RepID=UPI0025FC5B83|nr:DUF1320 domain-containing protein [Methylobacter sp.]MCK9622001.1 DUF1320 domain-containing protein [Methylobacter sp.]
MAYCTKQNLIDRFGEAELIQLTDENNLGVINDTVLTQAITDADADINSYLTAYPLPLVTIPANLVRIACDIARYYLFDDQVVSQVETRYNNAIKYLQMVAKGQITIAPDTSGDIATTEASGVDYVEGTQSFDSDEF